MDIQVLMDKVYPTFCAQAKHQYGEQLIATIKLILSADSNEHSEKDTIYLVVSGLSDDIETIASMVKYQIEKRSPTGDRKAFLEDAITKVYSKFVDGRIGLYAYGEPLLATMLSLVNNFKDENPVSFVNCLYELSYDCMNLCRYLMVASELRAIDPALFAQIDALEMLAKKASTNIKKESDVKEISVEMPPVNLVCPYCQHEEEHFNIFSPADSSHILATGETYCEECEKKFNVILTQ